MRRLRWASHLREDIRHAAAQELGSLRKLDGDLWGQVEPSPALTVV